MKDDQILTNIVSFLTGVNDDYFEEDCNDNLLQKLYCNENSGSIRLLCQIRTKLASILYIKDTLINDFDLTDILKELSIAERPEFEIGETILDTLININREIYDRFLKIKNIFPSYIDLNQIENLICFSLEDNNFEYLKKICKYFIENRNYYPYQVFINIYMKKSYGNLYQSDRHLLSILSANETSQNLKVDDLEKFIENARSLCILVDCENTDVYKFYGFLKSLRDEQMKKIRKISLINDKEHQQDLWDLINEFSSDKVQFLNVTRVIKDKSRVDLTLAIAACKFSYVYGIKDIIVVSSDSDYSTLYEQMISANFFVLYDKAKWSKKSADFCNSHYIKSTDINKFVPDTLKALKDRAITNSINKVLQEKFSISYEDIINAVKIDCKLVITEEIKEIIYKKLSSVKLETKADTLIAYIDKNRG